MNLVNIYQYKAGDGLKQKMLWEVLTTWIKRRGNCKVILVGDLNSTFSGSAAPFIGHKWKHNGPAEPTTGTEIVNSALAGALQHGLSFSGEEWDDFGVDMIPPDSFIKSGSWYYTPVGQTGFVPPRQGYGSPLSLTLRTADERLMEFVKATGSKLISQETYTEKNLCSTRRQPF